MMEQVKLGVTKVMETEKEEIMMQMKVAKEKIDVIQEEINVKGKEKRVLENQYTGLEERLERLRYNGLTQHEYFKAIWGMEIEDGDYTIRIGGVWENELSARITFGKKEYTLKGRFSLEGGLLRIANLDKNGGVKSSKERTYSDLSEADRQIYEDLSVVKNKYGSMMVEGKIKPLSSLKE
ncbi:hypothetical protein bcgnr5372_26890 [Bacillus luti]